MSPREIGHRVSRKASHALQRFGLFNAARPPVPDLGRPEAFWVPLGSPQVDARPYVEAAREIARGRVPVFALEPAELGDPPRWNRDPLTGTEAPPAFGPSLDYRDERIVGDIKYLWEPNRHLQLVTLVQAWRLTGDSQWLEVFRRHLDSWFEQCPYLRGPNWSSALEAGIRLVNWALAWQWLGGLRSELFRGAAGEAFRDRWLRSVYQHAHFVVHHFSAHSSANNHLIGEAAGVYVAARTWRGWRSMERWGERAKRILEREALLQNAPDGVNREQAVSYQQFVFDFLMLAWLAGRGSGDAFSPAYGQRLEAMLEFLASIMDAGGNVPMIGDADDGYAVRLSREADFCPFRSILATGAVLFRRAEFAAKAGRMDHKTLWLLGRDAQPAFASLRRSDRGGLPVRMSFPEGGYYILGSAFETPREVRMIMDVGPLGYLSIAAHGHADALSVVLSVGGREILVDPGTYVYHTRRRWRDWFRGTAAHNTVRVDGQDQSVIGGSFLWTRHARAWCERWEAGETGQSLAGCHDGYRRLPGSVIHCRAVRYESGDNAFHIEDRLRGGGRHTVERFWHFSEHCEVTLGDGGRIDVRHGPVQVRLIPAEPVTARLLRGSEEPPGGWVSRRFDVRVPSATVCWRCRMEGDGVLHTRMEVLV